MQRARILLGLATFAAGGCGDGTGPSPAQGVWEFDATYGGNGYDCSITGATLTLQREAGRWTGSLSSGSYLCVPPPGNPPPVPQPGGTLALDSIPVEGTAVSFRLLDEPFMSGTWTARRVDATSAGGRL